MAQLTGKIKFSYDKTWYLLPPRDTEEKQKFFGLLFEGKVLYDKSAFRKRKDRCNNSKIRIADFKNIFRWFSEPYIYAVKLDKRTGVESTEESHFWYASKVTVMAVLNCWDLFAKFSNRHNGDINLDGQPYIPEGLVFPTVVEGDLVLSHSELPSKIRLPSVVEGELKIQACNIPPTWKLPLKMDCLNLDGSSFYSNMDFREMTIRELHINNCLHPAKLKWPKLFPGRLTIAGERISIPDFFPEEVSHLSVIDSKLEKAAVLPSIIAGELSFVGVSVNAGVKMPKKCKIFTALESKFPPDFSFPAGLRSIEFILCQLAEGFRLPGSKPIHLIFNEMYLPSTLKFPKQFKGKLEFIHCRISGTLNLPEAIIGRLLLGHCTIEGSLKIFQNKGCSISMYKEDKTDRLTAPETVLKKIKFEKDPQSRSNEEELPF